MSKGKRRNVVVEQKGSEDSFSFDKELAGVPEPKRTIVDFCRDVKPNIKEMGSVETFNPRSTHFRENLYQSFKTNGWTPRVEGGKADVPLAFRDKNGQLWLLRGNSRWHTAKQMMEQEPTEYARIGFPSLTIDVIEYPLNASQQLILMNDRDYGQEDWTPDADRMYWEQCKAQGIPAKRIAQMMGLSSIPSQHQRLDILRQFPETSKMVDEWVQTRVMKEKRKYDSTIPEIPVLDNNFVNKLATAVNDHLKSYPASTSPGTEAINLIAQYEKEKAEGRLSARKMLPRDNIVTLSRELRACGETVLADTLLFVTCQRLDATSKEGATLPATEQDMRLYLREHTELGKPVGTTVTPETVSAAAPSRKRSKA